MKGDNSKEKGTAKSTENALAVSSTVLSQLQSITKEFEKDVIGNFILKLYHELHIQSDGLVPKKTVWGEYSEYIKVNSYEENFGNVNVETLLRRNNFLYNTPKSSKMYDIPMKKIFEFRNEKLKYLDEFRISNGSAMDSILPESTDSSDKTLEATIEVSPDAEEFPVIYQGGCIQQVVPNFIITNLGCFICQKNFQLQSDFEDHISTHGFDSDFEFLSTIQKQKSNSFEIIYRLCTASHYFSFTMKTNEKDIVIEKIIIVQTRLMHYVKNNKVPYEVSTDGMDSFLVDSHLFTIGVEQPIIVVYRYKFDEATRFVEQHHFLRTEEFPRVHFPVRFCRVPYNKVMKNKLKLQDYFPSPELKVAQKANFSDASLCNISGNFRKYLHDKVLNAENMCDILQSLLQIEDLEGMRQYVTLRQKGVKINRFGREYSVKFRQQLENVVTPLDEIILILSESNSETDLTNFDDTLLTRYPNRNNRNGKQKIKKYFAIVERVYANNICFKYEKSVINENKLYDIILRPSRLELKYQYRAIEMLSSDLEMRKYLFPSDQNFSKCTSISTEDLELFNTTIGNNPEQLQAVRNIADGANSFAPYVIFGPPGTGKTATVVEAVLQLWQRHPDTRILITAGSNSACDEVALRLCRVLIDLQPDKPNILRIFAKSNEKRIESIEDILIQASNFYCAHFYPDVEVIREYRIVVCTLSVVGKLVTAAIGHTFFTHIFIDECAASTQPEVFVGWMGTSSSKTRLIISGDHKQLGPIIRSERASELGLNVSFMERLMDQRCYAVDKNGDYDRSIQTRLIQNFRSHPEIVSLYNRMYYNGELKAMANKDDTTWALQWHLLRNKNHPIVFHSVYGSCKKGNNSISLCNELEVSVVMDYVKDLMYFGIKGRKIDETDIGIISPYKKQFTRIQEELNERQWNQIEVGAVETFQGKEKPIIIVSTVRSFTKTLGFLENPRRLNVILSRAKSLLIIIGNPMTLSINKDFKYIIDECRRKNCTVGGFRGYDDEKSGDKKELIIQTKSNKIKKNSRKAHATQSKLPNFVSKPQKTSQNNWNQGEDVKASSNSKLPERVNGKIEVESNIPLHIPLNIPFNIPLHIPFYTPPLYSTSYSTLYTPSNLLSRSSSRGGYDDEKSSDKKEDISFNKSSSQLIIQTKSTKMKENAKKAHATQNKFPNFVAKLQKTSQSYWNQGEDVKASSSSKLPERTNGIIIQAGKEVSATQNKLTNFIAKPHKTSQYNWNQGEDVRANSSCKLLERTNGNIKVESTNNGNVFVDNFSTRISKFVKRREYKEGIQTAYTPSYTPSYTTSYTHLRTPLCCDTYTG